MPIQPGAPIPSLVLKHLTEYGMQDISTGDVFASGRVVLFGVPGCFTPTCSMKHLPGFLDNLEALTAAGVDRAVCMAVNDPFVMKAWAAQGEVGDRILMLPDGNAAFAKALGLDVDSSAYGMGTRCHRFALVAEDGVAVDVAIEEPGTFGVSSAEAVLERLAARRG